MALVRLSTRPCGRIPGNKKSRRSLKGIAAPAGTSRAPHCPVTTRSKSVLESSEPVWRRMKSSSAPAIYPPMPDKHGRHYWTPPHQSLVQRPPFKFSRHVGAFVTQIYFRFTALPAFRSGDFVVPSFAFGESCINCSQERCRASTRREISVRKNVKDRVEGEALPLVKRIVTAPFAGTAFECCNKEADFIGSFTCRLLQGAG